MEINGKSVMITGGARIGSSVAVWLAQRGARNFILTYNSSKTIMQQTARELSELGADVSLYQMDATKESAVNTTVDAALNKYGQIEILINMASVYKARNIGSITFADWREDLDSNATSTLLCMMALAPKMVQQGEGRIINFADWTVASRRVNYPSHATYYAAKHAVIGLTEAFALEYAPKVLINCIAPGPIIPPPDLSIEESNAIAEQTPIKKWGGAEEIAEAVGFFIRTNFVTGECLRVDGGRHLL